MRMRLYKSIMLEIFRRCELSGYREDVAEVSMILGYDVASVDTQFPTFRDKIFSS